MTRILLSSPFQKFVEASPVTVMMRGIIENLFHPERLERLFNETAVTQYTRTLPFATVAEVRGEVVFNVSPSVRASLTVCRDDLWMADRNFCVLAFLFGIILRNARFAIRHHASMPIELVGRRTLVGKSETGRVYEQKARIADPDTGRIKKILCVTLVLKTPVFRNLTTAQLASLLKQLAKGGRWKLFKSRNADPKIHSLHEITPATENTSPPQS